jgi:hypothetical protein
MASRQSLSRSVELRGTALFWVMLCNYYTPRLLIVLPVVKVVY